jgi:hypothetical protein
VQTLEKNLERGQMAAQKGPRRGVSRLGHRTRVEVEAGVEVVAERGLVAARDNSVQISCHFD